MRFRLTDEEREVLDRNIVGEGGMQFLLRSLKLNRSGNIQELSAGQAEKVLRYSYCYGPGTFQDRLQILGKRLLRLICQGKDLGFRVQLSIGA